MESNLKSQYFQNRYYSKARNNKCWQNKTFGDIQSSKDGISDEL